MTDVGRSPVGVRSEREDGEVEDVSSAPQKTSFSAPGVPKGKRKSVDVVRQKGEKRRRHSGDGAEAGAMKTYGHLVKQTGLVSVRHALGKLAIPDVEGIDSESEESLFLESTPDNVWIWYRNFAEEIIERSKLSEETAQRLRKLCFDTFHTDGIPLCCRVDGCKRRKPVFTKTGYLRHMVEAHLPERPSWPCPFSGGKCRSRQPRRIALARHIAWEHGRSYPLAAALTCKHNTQVCEANPQWRELTESKAVVVKSGKRIPSKSRPVISSDSDSDLDASPRYELIEEISIDLPLVVGSLTTNKPDLGLCVAPTVPLPTKLNPPPIGSPKRELGQENDTRDLAKVSPGGPIHNVGTDEAFVASQQLMGVLDTMEDKAEARSELKPEFFLFEDAPPARFLDPNTRVIENMICQLQDLKVNCGAQAQLCEGLASSMGVVRRMADEHEGNLQATDVHLQELVKWKRETFKAQQGKAERDWRCQTLEERASKLEAEVVNKDRSISLLEDHVKTLQADVRRLTKDNKEAEEKLRSLEVESGDSIAKIAAQVAAILQDK